MRIVLASLIAATAAVSVAQAQTPAPAPPATPAPAADQPAAPAPPAATPPVATPDAAAPPAAAEPPPPTVPTTGDGAAIISLVEKVCVPLVRGGNLDDIAKANSATLGLKKNRRDNSWTMPLGTTNKDYNVTIFAPGANKDVCRGEVHYALGEDKPIVSAVNIWSFLHQPELISTANYVAVDPDGVKRVRKSWEHLDSTSSIGINFSTWTKPDDSSLNAKYSTGEIFYQERKLG
ncbi:hypothetical protein [Phenylobacterium sp.]|jgi:hypothetical protein|uniref:hypothetical protein n=1 Tax=Phenylobacterium sp. TaxID=1871053 RepID=UPI002E36EAC0|nr:hypothetical protein [Phenylobacterium sp.]HEX3365121.1 hypothetical protein [Phenylobacterium sp.]